MLLNCSKFYRISSTWVIEKASLMFQISWFYSTIEFSLHNTLSNKHNKQLILCCKFRFVKLFDCCCWCYSTFQWDHTHESHSSSHGRGRGRGRAALSKYPSHYGENVSYFFNALIMHYYFTSFNNHSTNKSLKIQEKNIMKYVQLSPVMNRYVF